MVTLNTTIIRGLKTGFNTTFQLSKIMVPIYVLVVLLKHTGILEGLSQGLEPVMKVFGLPGEAAYALVLGNFLNPYAAIGAMSAIALSAKEITTIAIMLLICHNIFIETAVIKGCGLRIGPFVLARVGIALAAGLVANILL